MNSDFDILIVGGGPAGLSSAIYALRAGYRTALLEKTGIGGQAALTNEIENYPGFQKIGGYELTAQMYAQAQSLGLKTLYEEVLSVKKEEKLFTVSTRTSAYTAPAVIIATGAAPRKLGFEEAYIGKGVSYCATCDGNFYRGKTVAVIGGGNTAVGDALYLSKIAQKVYLIHRRDAFRAGKLLMERVDETPNLEKLTPYVPLKIDGERVETLTVKHVSENEEKTISLNGIFVAAGQLPQSEFLSGLTERTENGYLVSDTRMRTGVDGLFVAGDVRDTALRQIVTACADGAVAAEQAAEYLQQK